MKLFILISFLLIASNVSLSNDESVEHYLNQIIEEVLVDSSLIDLKKRCGIDSVNTFYVYNSILFDYSSFYFSQNSKFEKFFGHKLNDSLSDRKNAKNLYIEDSLRVENFEEIEIDKNKLNRFGDGYELFLMFDIIEENYFVIDIYCGEKHNYVISYLFSINDNDFEIIHRSSYFQHILIE